MRLRDRSVLLVLSLWVSFASRAASPEEAGHPMPWHSAEEVRPEIGTQDTDQLLEWLVSGDRARSAEAQIRLLAVAEPLLPPLEALAAHRRREPEREAVRELLRVLTASSLRIEQLTRYPTLAWLVRQDVARGFRLVASSRAGESTEGVVVKPWVDPALSLFGCAGLGNDRDPSTRLPEEQATLEGATLESLRDALVPLGGLALPALEGLLSSSSVAVRLRGLALASELKLRPGTALFERLLADPTRVELTFIRRGERSRAFFSLASLGQGLLLRLGELPDESISHPVLRIERRSARWFEIASIPGAAPFAGRFNPLSASNFLNTHEPAGLARDEQEYWNRLRPLWRAWWHGAPWGSSPGAAAYWNALAFERRRLGSPVPRSSGGSPP